VKIGYARIFIVLWNTVYLERAVQVLRDSGKDVDDKLLPHLLTSTHVDNLPQSRLPTI
jgi:hypothetical protein